MQFLPERRHLAFNSRGDDLMYSRVALVQIVEVGTFVAVRVIAVAVRAVQKKKVSALASIGTERIGGGGVENCAGRIAVARPSVASSAAPAAIRQSETLSVRHIAFTVIGGLPLSLTQEQFAAEKSCAADECAGHAHRAQVNGEAAPGWLPADHQTPGRRANDHGESWPDKEMMPQDEARPADRPFAQRQPGKDRPERTERAQDDEPITDGAELAPFRRAGQEEGQQVEEAPRPESGRSGNASRRRGRATRKASSYASKSFFR